MSLEAEVDSLSKVTEGGYLKVKPAMVSVYVFHPAVSTGGMVMEESTFGLPTMKKIVPIIMRNIKNKMPVLIWLLDGLGVLVGVAVSVVNVLFSIYNYITLKVNIMLERLWLLIL